MKYNSMINKMLWSLCGLLCITSLTSCLSDDDETIVIETAKNNTGIPDDSQAAPNPEITSATTNVPNIQTTVDYVEGIPVIRIDMTGVKNSNDAEWLRLYGTGNPDQNIWVEVDDKPKGIDVYNNADHVQGRSIKTDVVFTVDNSGSMGDEADAIARDIISWSKQLANSGLDVRFGVVGYDGRITGGIDLTTAEELSNYLNYGSGTKRTAHFGSNRSDWTSLASKYMVSSGQNECGVAAIRMADENYKFRASANRVYVNFTDEPNQPNSNSTNSVKYFEDQSKWSASQGTVHTVYSDSRFSTNTWNVREQPWLISDYTGGTTIFTSSSFTGVTLASLPVTGAMENSYIIRFTNIENQLDGQQHKVHITILSKEGTVAADKTFYVVFGK